MFHLFAEVDSFRQRWNADLFFYSCSTIGSDIMLSLEKGNILIDLCITLWSSLKQFFLFVIIFIAYALPNSVNDKLFFSSVICFCSFMSPFNFGKMPKLYNDSLLQRKFTLDSRSQENERENRRVKKNCKHVS